MAQEISQAIARPTRTAAQLTLAGIVIEFVDSMIYNLDDRGYAASVALLAVIIGYVQILVENRTGKGFLRKPEPPEKPVALMEESPHAPRHYEP